MADSEQKPGNFTVTDRRAFDASGERKAEEQTDAPSAAPASAPPPVEPDAGKPVSERPRTPNPSRALPPADLATLVLSLGSSAVSYLGEEEGQGGKKPDRNLTMAKHAIDLLTVLEEKTRGNLSAEEDHLLSSLLFDLRLRYVEALKTSPAGG